MAREDVKVQGGGDFDGAIFKNAASESTLQRLVDVMEAKQKGLGQQVLGIANKVINQNIQAQKGSTSAAQSFTNTLKNSTSVSKGLFDVFTNIVGLGIGTTFSLISTAGEELVGFLKTGYDAFRDASKVGASFNNNLLDLRKAAAEAAIPLDEFVQLIKNNSQTFTTLGGTVTEGAKRFGELSKEFRDSEFGSELTAMGFSIGEMNNLLADQIELDMRGGKLRGKDNATLRKETEAYILQLDELTKVTGLSREELQKGLKQAMKDGRILTMQSRLSGDALTTFKNTMGMMTANIDPSMMNSLTQMMGGIIDPTDDFAKYLAMAVPGIQQFEEAVGKGQVSIEDQIKFYKEQSKEIKSYLSQFHQSVIDTQPGLQKLAQYNASIQNLINSNTDGAQAEQKARDAITTAFGKVAKAFNDIYSKFIEKIMSSPIFKMVIDRLEQFADVINLNSQNFVNSFGKVLDVFNTSLVHFADNINKEGIISALVDLFKELFAGIRENLGPIIYKVFSGMSEDPKLTKQRAEYAKMTPEQQAEAVKKNPKLAEAIRTPKMEELPDLFGPITEGLKQLTSYVPALSDLALYFGIGAAGTIVTGVGLSVGIAALAGSLSGLAAPALALGAAIGMTGAGLGAAFYGLSKVIDSVNDSFTKIKDFFIGMSSLDPNKMKSIGDSIGPIAEHLGSLGTGAIYNLIGGNSLDNLIVSLTKLNQIDLSNFVSLEPLNNFITNIEKISSGNVTANFISTINSMSESLKSGFQGFSVESINKTFTELNEALTLGLQNFNINPINKIFTELNEALTLGLQNLNINLINKTFTELNEALTLGLQNLTDTDIAVNLKAVFQDITKAFDSLNGGTDLNALNKVKVAFGDANELLMLLKNISQLDVSKKLNVLFADLSESLTLGLQNLTDTDIVTNLKATFTEITGSITTGMSSIEKINVPNDVLISLTTFFNSINSLSETNVGRELPTTLTSLSDSVKGFVDTRVSEQLKESLKTIQLSINEFKIDNDQSLISVTKFVDTIKTIGNDNIGQNLTSSIESIQTSFKTLNIDTTNVDNAVSAINKFKAAFNQPLQSQTEGVDKFSKSIETLTSSLESLENQLKNSPMFNSAEAANILNNRTSTNVSPVVGGISPEEYQRQLNMKVDELITHIKEMKQNTKDTVDTLSGRRRAI